MNIDVEILNEIQEMESLIPGIQGQFNVRYFVYMYKESNKENVNINRCSHST